MAQGGTQTHPEMHQVKYWHLSTRYVYVMTAVAPETEGLGQDHLGEEYEGGCIKGLY